MCTVLLPPGDNPIAVNKYNISYQMKNDKRGLHLNVGSSFPHQVYTTKEVTEIKSLTPILMNNNFICEVED